MQCNNCEREGSTGERYERTSETPRSVKKQMGRGVLGIGAANGEGHG